MSSVIAKTVFGDMLPEVVEKKWGYERIITNHEFYCGKILTVVPNGNACSLHYHIEKHETFHILRGRLYIQLVSKVSMFSPEQVLILHPGSTLAVPQWTAHRFWAEREVCDFMEVSMHDKPEDSIRFAESGKHPENPTDFGLDTTKLEWRK